MWELKGGFISDKEHNEHCFFHFQILKNKKGDFWFLKSPVYKSIPQKLLLEAQIREQMSGPEIS